MSCLSLRKIRESFSKLKSMAKEEVSAVKVSAVKVSADEVSAADLSAAKKDSEKIVVSVTQSLFCNLFHSDLKIVVYPPSPVVKDSVEKPAVVLPDEKIYNSIEGDSEPKEVPSEQTIPESQTLPPVESAPSISLD